MMLGRAATKAEGLDRLKRYLLSGRKTAQELASILKVDRTTLWRWRQDLERRGYEIKEDSHRRIYIDPATCPTYLKLLPQESILLLLALRLFQHYNDKPNRHAVEMLHKLGTQLHAGVAPAVGPHVVAMAEHQRGMLPDQRTDYERIFEVVGTAWLQGRKVRLFYRPLHAHRPFEEVFHIYMLEPSAIGRGTYLIGYAESVNALRVRKLERIQRPPILLDEPVTVPATFDVQQLFAGAWGVWFDEDEQPTTVTLRFSVYVARRVEETRWHPSERRVRDAEGRVIWTAEIDAVEEMLPWIRSWGADCEVLEPARVRDQLTDQLRQQARLYGLHTGTNPTEGPDPELLTTLWGG